MDYKQQSSLTSYKGSKIPSTSVPKPVRSGTANVRERSTFGGTSWKPKKLELDTEALTIINPSSKRRTRILLRDITELERTDLTDHSLGLKANEKRFNFSFSSDAELYDWQDDIYQRCPLGNYSAPFDFVHKSHIGSDTVSGTFADTNILPIYAEIIGGQPAVSKSSPTIVAAPRSRPPSGAPLAVISKGISPSSGSAVLEGLFVIKQSGLFAGWLWKQRWITLTPQALVIHRRNNKASPASKSIPLPALTRIEPDVKRDNCLLVEFTTRPNSSSSSAAPTDMISILFKGNTELYTWRDALYLRSALSSPIGLPTNFVHHVHVGFDPMTGAFTGLGNLPSDWQAAVNPAPPTPADKKARRQSRRKSVPLVAPVSA
ncbi:hypothetical protein GALMADRAFT_230406 [Galerina marginata CBS 339.88]|uniref:Non-specific serine/threonine protein kinase n=1 Tax=Galerina marginata (strain CBS 339.88) TaxID=685588 RepID=A0A067SJ95_GALM3|nr:hypothetical protein GALMADRAFT_230406 [Galerina marginata CBS 339.88]